MPLPFPQECNVMLTAISEDIGQINGMAFGCERWNVASLQNLNMHLGALIGETLAANCHVDAIDSMWKSDEERGPILQMLETVQNVLETYGLTPGGLEDLAKEPVDRASAINVLVQNLQTDWLDAVTHITDYYGQTSHPVSSNGTSDLAIPEAVWPARPEQIQCWIEAGGGGELKDPQTGEIISIAEAEKRFHWTYNFDFNRFEWNWDPSTGKGTPGQAYADTLELLLSMKRQAQLMEMDEWSSELIHEDVRMHYSDLWEALREGDEGNSDYIDALRDLGFRPYHYGSPLPSYISEQAERRVKAVLEMMPHPRQVRNTKDLLDFIDSTTRNRERLIDQDQDLRIAITAAEEIAIDKGREAGSCPPSPDAWFDHRSETHQRLIRQGIEGLELTLTDPKTGEVIDEGEAIGRLHYEPSFDDNVYPDPRWWWSYTTRASAEAQDVENATVALQNILYSMDSMVRREQIDFSDQDMHVNSQYQEFWRKFVNPVGDTYLGEQYGEQGQRILKTLVDRNVLPRRIRGYAGLAGLIDKMDQIRGELQDEDMAMLRAIMEAEENAIGRGLGLTPEAWFDQRSDRHQTLIFHGAGGSLKLTDPKTGEVIEESEAIDRLHFRPYEDKFSYPGDEYWYLDSDAQSDRAKGVKRSLTLLHRKQNQLGVGAEMGDYPKEGQLDAEAREEYSELYSMFSKIPITAPLVEEGILPARVRSFAALSSVVSKLQVMELALQAEDEDLLKALMEAEANAIERGLGQTPSATTSTSTPSTPSTPSAEFGVFYTPEEFDPRIEQYNYWETGVLDYTEDDSPFTDAYLHEGTEVDGEGELLDDEVEMREDMPKQMFNDGEISKAEVVWDVEGIRVGISYGPWTSRLGEYIDHAAYVDISSYSGGPLDQFIFQRGGPIQEITKLLDGIHRKNLNIRVVATASTDVRGRGDIRARVYERYGWKRIGATDASGSVDMELPHPDKRSSGSASAFAGIGQYADAIMELG